MGTFVGTGGAQLPLLPIECIPLNVRDQGFQLDTPVCGDRVCPVAHQGIHAWYGNTMRIP